MSLSPVEPLASLDELAHLGARELQRQMDHFDALDSKAGLVLAFAAVLVGLTPPVHAFARGTGAALAAAAAVLALLAMWPRRLEVLDLYTVRKEALDRPALQTRRLLLETRVAAWQRNQALLRVKAGRLRVGFALVVIAAASYAGGILAAAIGEVL